MYSENAQVHTFVYISGGVLSVKCVCPAFEMDASKEEQRDVIRFLVAEGAATRHKVKTPWEYSRTESSFCMIMPVPRIANLMRDNI